MSKINYRWSVFVLTFIGFLFFVATTRAATFTVNTTSDTNDGFCNEDCSLREAVLAANAAAGDDVIEFSSSFNIERSILLNSEIVFENNGALTINGRGVNLLTVSGGFSNRIFRNNGATVVLNGMTLYGGTGNGANSGLGGAILNSENSTLTLNDSAVRNSTANQGGGIYNQAALILNNTEVFITNAVSVGGGIYSTGILTLNNSTIRENTAPLGGGIFNDGATVSLTNSTVTINSATGEGGGIYNLGTLNLTASTINSNTAGLDGGGVFSGAGSTVMNAVNSTFSRNSAKGAGGGLYVSNNSVATIGSSTLSANISDSDRSGSGSGGAIFNTPGGTVNVSGTIIGANLDRSTVAPDFSGVLTSQGYNLIGNTLGATITGTITGNILDQNPQLLPLGDYGGPTRTHALQANSPAIDAGNAANFSPTDQRGVMRPQDGDLNTSALPDIGAFERHLATLTVTKTADTNDGACDADCSLREAISSASGNPTRENIINFSPAVFNVAQTITLSLGEILITDAIFTINGTGADLLTLSGNNLNRIFILTSSGTMLARNLTITAGKAAESPTVGGAVYNVGGTFSLSDGRITASSAGFGGGGGIGSSGGLLITNSVISGNSATGEGGGIVNGGLLVMVNSTVSGNTGSNGAGIRTTSEAEITNSTLDGNNGAAIYNDTGTLTLRGSTVSANTGGVQNVFGGTVNISNCIIRNNLPFAFGGGGVSNIGTLNIADSIVTGNSGGRGAGIYTNGTFNLTNTTVANNSATSLGGGIYIEGGTANIDNSTINNNTGSNGGGIASNIPNAVNITNTTITANTATSSGGGIRAFGPYNLTNVTICDNSAATSGGGISILGSAVFAARNSIFGDNRANSSAPDFQGTLTSQGYNLIENTSGMTITGTTTGNILGKDPLLSPLRNNGGATQTVALQPLSPAIDAGDPGNFPETDQRGVTRPQDGDLNGANLPDMGAYERQVFSLTVTKTADTNDGLCDADCSLREALATVEAAVTPDNAIYFDASFSTPQTINLNGSELIVPATGTLLISGRGADLLTISGNNIRRVMTTDEGSNLTMTGATITGGNGQGAFDNGHGGGIRSGNNAILTLYNVVVEGNSVTGVAVSGVGGGVAFSNGKLNVINSIVRNNTTSRNAGGGIYGFNATLSVENSVISGNTAAGDGGGIFMVTGTVLLNNSTVRNNTATDGAGIGMSGQTLVINNSTINNNIATDNGGAIQALNTTAVMTNSTVSGNTARSGGGGLYSGGGSMTLVNSTVAFNDADSDNNGSGVGGGIYSSTTLNARNTIFAKNKAAETPNVFGLLTSQGYNLIDNTTGMQWTGTTTGNITNVEARLDPILRNNGGATQTHALRVGSPALDKGSAVTGLSTDQRALARPFDFPSIPNASGGNGSDIGAYEQQADDIFRSFVPFDFDGDGRTDISIFRPSVGEWWIHQSSSLQTVAAQFGNSADKPVPSDYTSDGKTDIAFFRPATGEWFILRSEDASFLSFPFGASGDIPSVGDFDADGKADPTVFRPSTGEWFILRSTGGTTITTFGAAGDKPVPADFDGDGRTDIAIFRPSDGSWWYVRSTDNQFRVFSFGTGTDKPVTGDYTGDGKADIAVWRPSTGEWFFQRSEDNSYFSVPFGAAGDMPAPADYDGDGRADTAVFRPSETNWYINRSTAGLLIQQFGASDDLPIPGVFVP